MLLPYKLRRRKFHIFGVCGSLLACHASLHVLVVICVYATVGLVVLSFHCLSFCSFWCRLSRSLDRLLSLCVVFVLLPMLLLQVSCMNLRYLLRYAYCFTNRLWLARYWWSSSMYNGYHLSTSCEYVNVQSNSLSYFLALYN